MLTSALCIPHVERGFMQLKQLLELQDLDNHILRIKAELGDIPRQLEMHQSKLTAAIAREKELHVKAEAALKDRHTKELDLKTREDEIQKLGSQLYSVKTNEQYKAMQHEIDEAKSKKSKLEDALLEVMEAIDKSKDEISQSKMIVQQEQSRFKETEQKFKMEIDRLEGLLKEAEIKRDTLTRSIDPNLLKIYNKISLKWSGSALVPIRGNVCQGCSMTLPPQVINEVRKNERIVRCEDCSRILYMNESELN